MTPEKLQSIAFKWFDAFNSHNLEQLLLLYDEDAEHFSPKLKIRQPETNGLVIGKGALRNFGRKRQKNNCLARIPRIKRKGFHYA